MKIENSGITSLPSNKAESSQRTDKNNRSADVQTLGGDKDKAVVSDNARLLAKARTALDKSAETSDEKVNQLRSQVESGDYTLKIDEVAKKLAAHLHPKA
ncbi:MAG: flagellar biosynthesis anti-sigma factor FlgM [Anaerolineaceae bacterium]|nr:flagellar biosynthesis anti-sigma factor FlgM [Anaerolineaceae bacterium]